MSPRKLLMIPGPIEFDPTVLSALGMPSKSHVAPDFIESFGHCLEMMREVWLAPTGQPFILAGSGTLAMDVAGANLVEPGDRALVISTGYFGDRYADLLSRYGAQVTVLRAETGQVVTVEEIESALNDQKYKLMTFTHVDTSTAVRVDPKPLGELGKKYGVITVLDGVCSVAGEEIRQEEWGIDVVLTASQKAVGVPPGLALLVCSDRAMDAWKKRKSPVMNYYADFTHWLPIMEAYENRKPAYFGTPAVNLVAALEVSLRGILDEGMDQRFLRHQVLADKMRRGLDELNLKRLPASDTIAANTLSAVWYPENIAGGEFLKQVSDAGIILAGGLAPDIKTKYFRIGHMGALTHGDVVATLDGIGRGLGGLR